MIILEVISVNRGFVNNSDIPNIKDQTNVCFRRDFQLYSNDKYKFTVE